MILLSLLRRHANSIVIVFLLFLFTFSIQLVSGASHKELADFSDEPAHVVSSLMVHDYLSMKIPESPIRYAERYYAHYPKVAIGIWPPLMYVIAGLWMFLFGVSRTALLLLSGAIVATLSCTLALFVKRLYGPILGLTAGAMFIALRDVQRFGTTFMIDMAVGLAAFAAMLLMERYFRDEQLWVAISLGLCIGGAMLLKGNAIALVLMPGFMLLGTGRFDLLKKPGLYVTALIVLIIGVPWQIVTFRLLAKGGNVLALSFRSILLNARGYAVILLRDFTPLVTALVLVGLVLAFWSSRTKSQDNPNALTAVGCLFLAWVVFHCIVPVVGSVDPRYMVPLMAPGIVLFLSACKQISGRFSLGARTSPAIRLSLLIVCALVSAGYAGAFDKPNLPELGFIRVADVALDGNSACCSMLIDSDSIGEGAFVEEVALRDRTLSRIVLRGSKVISKSPWNGQTFEMLFQNDADLARCLDADAIDVVIVDLSATDSELARKLLLSALHREPNTWSVTRVSGSFSRVFELYVRKDRSGIARPSLRVPMTFSLGRDITLDLR
jgi:Dolichyl-phosphate-mannose-protein mannosyltransferase